jgi:hypothetical protein
MGGSITVVVRRSNGVEVILDAWTNAIPYYVTEPDFMHEGASFEEYMGFNDKIPEINPDSYGVLIIDFVSKHMKNYQDYCSVPRMLCRFRGPERGGNEPDDAEQVLRMHESGRLVIKSNELDAEDISDPETVIRLLKTHENGFIPTGERLTFEAWLDYPGWTITNVSECGVRERLEINQFFESTGWKVRIPENRMRPYWMNENA